MSTDLAVDVHPFAGTPMAETMERRRQLRDTRWDAYADRVSGQAAEVADMDVTEVVDDAAVPAEAPVGPSPRPEAQRRLHAVPTRVLQQATEFPFLVASKIRQLTTEMGQSDAAVKRAEQLCGELEACRQQVAECDRQVQVAARRVQEAEQVAGTGIGWMKGRKKKVTEQQDIAHARREHDVAAVQRDTAIQTFKQRSRELGVATGRAERVQVSPERREQLGTEVAMYRSLQDVAEVNRELRDRQLETQHMEARAADTVVKDPGVDDSDDIEVVFDTYDATPANSASSFFGHSIEESLAHVHQRRNRKHDRNSTNWGTTPGTENPGLDQEPDGPEF